jgi:hypothetical protein
MLPSVKHQPILSSYIPRTTIRFLFIVVLIAVSPRMAMPGGELDEDQLRQLQALGYVTETEIDRTSKNKVGVTVHDPSRAYQGVNAFCSENSGTFKLMDMHGKVLRRVTVEVPAPRYEGNICKVAEWYDDKSLVMVVEQTELVRVDLDSRVIWRWPGSYHHDVDVSPDGTIYAIRNDLDRSLPALHFGKKITDDVIVQLSPTGESLKEFSLMEMVRLNPELWDRVRRTADSLKPGTRPPGPFDLFHVNTVEVIRERIPFREGLVFEKGDILFCARNFNVIGVIDAKTSRIKWHWGMGQLERPHMPTLLPDGRVMVFDNGVKRHYSRVLIVSPATSKIDWEYKSKPAEAFYSETRGGAEQLPNGNVLITESEKGRIFEITADGQIVWEYWNDDVTAEGNKRATIFRTSRVHGKRVPRPLR